MFLFFQIVDFAEDMSTVRPFSPSSSLDNNGKVTKFEITKFEKRDCKIRNGKVRELIFELMRPK